MKTRGSLRVAVFGAAVLDCAVAGGSEEPARDESLRMEVSPFYGYRMGGSFNLSDTGQTVNLNDHGAFSAALDLEAEPGAQYELFYGRQATKMSGAGFPPTD